MDEVSVADTDGVNSPRREEAPRSESLRNARTVEYLLLAPWTVRPGAGVNNAVLGLARAMEYQYRSEIAITGWDAPEAGQISLKLARPSLPLRNLIGFCVRLGPNLLRLRSLANEVVAINPHFFSTEILPLALLRRVHLIPKLILSVHGADLTYAASDNSVQQKLYRFICRSADLVVACSEALAEQVRAFVPGARVEAVWNGISMPPASMGPRPLESPYLVSVAAFVYKKGHDVLLNAFCRIAQEFPELRLVLLGADGPQREAVERTIREREMKSRVMLLRNVPHEEVWGWMHHAECFVHAAREEPFGIAILEAALAGAPVVATAVGGVPEYLTNGVHGITCEPDDAEQLALAIQQTLRDREGAHRRARAFREKARGFTWQAAWKRYRALAEL